MGYYDYKKQKRQKAVMGCLALLFLLVLSLLIDFGLSAVIIWIASLIFGFTFKWAYAGAAVIVIIILRILFGNNDD